MPLYEYQCKNCGLISEHMHKISETPLILCQNCSSEMTKLISSTAFHLKGSGWYVTDYSKKSSNTTTKKTEKAESSSASCCNSCPAKAANE